MHLLIHFTLLVFILTTAGILQFTSGTNHPELAQTTQIKGHGPQQDTSRKWDP